MSEETVRIAHISDLHFGADGYKDVSKALAKHLRENVKPHMVIVSGDLVDIRVQPRDDVVVQ
jgi:predicted MPP superfamily phosphohydrolase